MSCRISVINNNQGQSKCVEFKYVYLLNVRRCLQKGIQKNKNEKSTQKLGGKTETHLHCAEKKRTFKKHFKTKHLWSGKHSKGQRDG